MRTISSGDCPKAFVVLNDLGERVAPGLELCALVPISESLRPGTSYVFDQSWDGTDSSGSLPTGEYLVIGRVGSAQGFLHGGERRIRVVD